MGVTVIGIEDTIGGAVNRFGEVLGDVLDETVFRKGLKEKELRKDPDVMQGLVLRVRAAQRAGLKAMEGLAKGMDVNVEFLDEILSFTPTLAQATEERAILGGAAKAAADAMVATSKLTAANANAMFDAGVPALNAEATANGLQVEAGQAELDLEILNIRRESGVITSILKEEFLTAQLGEQTAGAILELLNNIDQSTEQGQHDAMALVLGLRNAAGLQHFQFHENMEFQEGLALFNATQGSLLNDADKIAVSKDLLTLWNTAIDRLREADDAGDKDFLAVAVEDLNNVRLMIQKANEADIVFDAIDTSIASLGKKFFGGLRLDLARQEFKFPAAAAFVNSFIEQHEEDKTEPTIEELGEILSSDAIIQDPSLTPSVREAILRDFPGFMEKLRTLQAQDVSDISVGEAFGAGAGVIVPGADIAIGAGTEALGFLYNKLTEGLKGAVGFLATQQERARTRPDGN